MAALIYRVKTSLPLSELIYSVPVRKSNNQPIATEPHNLEADLIGTSSRIYAMKSWINQVINCHYHHIHDLRIVAHIQIYSTIRHNFKLTTMSSEPSLPTLWDKSHHLLKMLPSQVSLCCIFLLHVG
jgi:hypothetical protein